MNWKILDFPFEQVHRLEKGFPCFKIIARIMVHRGIKSLKQSRSFFHHLWYNSMVHVYLIKVIIFMIEGNKWKTYTAIQLNVRDIIFYA